jgi:hypothetical protein
MKLDVSRLCLDCEEVHEHQVCPVCGSEAFAFLTRWVQPTSDVRLKAQLTTRETTGAQVKTPDQVEALRQLIEGKPAGRTGGLLAKGLVGLAAFGIAGWAWRSHYRTSGRETPPLSAPGNDSDRAEPS